VGLIVAWAVALTLAVMFGLYPAIRASRLSPMEAMR
jgi:ABC-type antimicrobial peptide transport system permease subunit